ncbi:hypothetical protein [Streptomyces sp. SID3212]|uniref:hypothetical protein n=1 Tax=unclassified Streptomyces TaxID=2593676 RepID=UPI00136A8663|nr:hypothetical protein [Streptomyces sp. SID3212]MYV56850.1 hypothetical protein [Streptomyces sp. SID3212]
MGRPAAGDADRVPDTALWEPVVGPRFVEALNDGLARAGWKPRPAPPSPVPARNGRDRPDLFAARVMASFGAALSTALAPEERGNRTLRLALLRRGREVLAEALIPAGSTAARRRGARTDRAFPERETFVRTLLMECVVMTVLEGSEFRGGGPRQAEPMHAQERPWRADTVSEHSRVGGKHSHA